MFSQLHLCHFGNVSWEVWTIETNKRQLKKKGVMMESDKNLRTWQWVILAFELKVWNSAYWYEKQWGVCEVDKNSTADTKIPGLIKGTLLDMFVCCNWGGLWFLTWLPSFCQKMAGGGFPVVPHWKVMLLPWVAIWSRGFAVIRGGTGRREEEGLFISSLFFFFAV